MGFDDVISLTISSTSPTPTRQAFGVAMLPTFTATWVERTRSYSGMTAVAVDWDPGEWEYEGAKSFFAQNPRAPKLVMGRFENAPTMQWDIAVRALANLTAYTVEIDGVKFTKTSDEGALNDEIIDGLKDLIADEDDGAEGIVATTTGSSGSHVLHLVADEAGVGHRVRLLGPDGKPSTAYLTITMSHTNGDPGVEDDLDAILAEDASWYCILNTFPSAAVQLAIADWADANERLFIGDTQDSGCVDVAEGSADDVMKSAKTAGHRNTALLYHEDNAEFAAAAWAGRLLPFDAGSEKWGLVDLAGVAASTLSDAQRDNVKAKKGNIYRSIAGVGRTLWGWTSSGEYIDTIRGVHAFAADLKETMFNLLSGPEKISFDDFGVARVQSELEAVVKRWVRAKLLKEGYVITVPKVADVSAQDRQDRILPDIEIAAQFAGAVQYVGISVTLTY